MIKKVLAVFLSTLLVLSFASCSKGTKDKASESTFDHTVGKIDYPETTIVDESNIKVVIKCISIVDGETYVDFQVTNNTDRELHFSADNIAVNKLMINGSWTSAVDAGSTADSTMYIHKTDGIENITDIAWLMKVVDLKAENPNIPYYEGRFEIYPQGEENIETYSYEVADTDLVLVDNENVRVLVRGFTPDDLFGYAVNAYVENRTDKLLMYSIKNASINDVACDPFWAAEVLPGCGEQVKFVWNEGTLKDAGIAKDKINKFTLPFTVTDYEGEKAIEYLNETFEFAPF